MSLEVLQKVLGGAEMSREEEMAAVEAFLGLNPKAAGQLCQLLLNQKHQVRKELAKEQKTRRELETTLEELREPPWLLGYVLRVGSARRVEVVCGGQRQIVTAGPEVDVETLEPGMEVCLNRDRTIVVACSEEPRRCGLVGEVAEVLSGLVVLRGVGDEEIVATASPALTESLSCSDRVVYSRETGVVLARLPSRSSQQYVLEQPPPVTFDDIGGLESVISHLRRVVDVHLLNPERARWFGLQPRRGIIFQGPPGCGKTMLAKALARHIADLSGDARFLYVAPGALRSIYYGGTEQRIRELFAVAARAPGIVVMFFDELDSYGARGVGIGQDIDGRVLGTLLAAIDGVGAPANIFMVSATNRLDLCDDALTRGKRAGDDVFHIPRPNRDAARQILSIQLGPTLPYAGGGDGATRAVAIVDTVASYLFAPKGGAPSLATVTLADGSRHEIEARHVLTGALLCSAVERAKYSAVARPAEPDGGLMLEDVLEGIDAALDAEKEKLRSPAAARRLLDFRGAEDIARVSVAPRRRRRHRYLRAL